MSEEKMLFELDGMRVPYSLEAEQSVLGAMIVDPSCINDVMVEVKKEYFHIPQNSVIFGSITEMYEHSETIDPVSILEKLKKDKLFDETGGKSYITQLVQIVPSAANVMTYISILKERYYARALLGAASDIIKDVNESTDNSEKLLDNAEQRIYDIRRGSEVSGLTHIKEVIENETYDRLTKIADPETHDDYVGIPCGINELDRMIAGLNKSDLIILGARPGVGKTSFALNIARNVAVQSGRKVCFFSLEMSRDQLAQRMLSAESGVRSDKLRTGELDNNEWTRLTAAGENLSKTQIFIDETSTITVPQMKAKLLRLKDVDLVIVDYLQLMNSAKRTENRVTEVSDITRNLKIMAKELHVPVLVCAQLSRGTEQRGKSHKPTLSDLRESGSIEQDADIVLFLYKESNYRDDASGDDVIAEDKAECIVAKNRHGETGTVKLHWDKEHTRFTAEDTIH
ncbi:MAG: replicative DNA helicase [Clostridia bacterium]|nr:replicative DNA helicase [Clostridia bacterium]